MFSSEERLKERRGKDGTSRFDYLQKLVTEFQSTTNEEAKQQIVANLANFAYDPINYDKLRLLHVWELFLDCLDESEELQEFGLGGLCNGCPDEANAAMIVEADGVRLIAACLTSSRLNSALAALATLYYLCNAKTRKDIMTPEVVQQVQWIADPASSTQVRLRNLAQAFLDRHFNPPRHR
eukprot:TRINITY_DN20814_c0_g1_i2.p1 TRINITY_DN20814_c0_g1~~TRINITY_DN20814_c0_g1_i2.p1  ORF type:complete len:181 (-),score=29.44 TRINITY_DN20814_c0_g1_i2:708-1250(-)